MFFYQIYDELQNVHERCANLEDQLMDNQTVTVQNRKNEAKLYQRVCKMEEEIKTLKMKQENADSRLEFYKEHCAELTFKYNDMVTTINTVIFELNHVISILNNKD